jgi:hypothetical protein
MIVLKLKNEVEFTELHPWYKGFTGEINRK